MYKIYATIILAIASSSGYGMFFENFGWGLDQQTLFSHEQKKQQEKEAYDKLHALVLTRISNKEDLNRPVVNQFAADFKKTPLHEACIGGNGNLPIIQLLLAHQANPNVLDLNKSTPLHYAVKANALETVLILLSSGAYSDSRDYLFGTPLQGICIRGDDILHDEDTAKKRVQIANALLSYGANPNAKNEFQTSCSHAVIATPRNCFSGIDSLKNKNKALFFSQRKALIRALLLYGATLNAKDSKDKDPIQKAYQAHDDPENQPYFIELADYALAYSNRIRTRLLSILGHSGTHLKHETPFKALPKDIVKCIIDFTYPSYNGPQSATTPQSVESSEKEFPRPV
jgi:ankyrin repeat protein